MHIPLGLHGNGIVIYDNPHGIPLEPIVRKRTIDSSKAIRRVDIRKYPWRRIKTSQSQPRPPNPHLLRNQDAQTDFSSRALCAQPAESLAFYVDLLGFELRYARPEANFAAVSFEGGELMLEEFSSVKTASDHEFEQGHWRTADFEYPLGRGVNFEFTVADVEKLHARISAAAYPIKLELAEKWYRVDNQNVGVKQFLVMDPDGYLIRFAQEIGSRPI